ncbi:MAG: hypothetical protein LBL97_00390 [Prevotellaceae bacterium]|jgi:hypothetical protein|nr:hypothetical protein [Prevotellaceae bacterium]
MKEEDNIFKKVGRENPFGVPNGYFDSLTQQVMSQLPEKETPALTVRRIPTRWERLKPWFYMAAMFAGAALIIRVASTAFTPSVDVAVIENTEVEAASDEYISTIVNSAMLDDYSLYIYLSEATAE